MEDERSSSQQAAGAFMMPALYMRPAFMPEQSLRPVSNKRKNHA
jgi:hypothetical protein